VIDRSSGEEHARKPLASSDEGGSQQPRPEVLVVEDDEDEISIIVRAIRRHGMEARFKIVRSGEDALEYLRRPISSDKHRNPPLPKVVILDLKLTGIGGREVLRRIRADEELHLLPVVILSSSRSLREMDECYLLGANSFVSKRPGLEPPGDHIVDIARYWLELNRPVVGP
jgi:two-component system response regulator